MHCPICNSEILSPVPARHLPHFARCPECTGYVTAEKTEALYPETYFTEEAADERKNIFSPLLNFFLWLRFRKIVRLLRHAEGVVLDYGCGNGKLVAYLRGKGLFVEGYDPSASAVALAQKRRLPVSDAVRGRAYDLIMFWHSLEHTDTPRKDVLAVTERLKKDGQLLIAVPNGDSLESQLFGGSWFCYDWPFHRVHFTPRALSVLLEQAGFRVLSVDHFNPEYTVSSLAQTFLNLFLPKNALYSLISKRRTVQHKLVVLGTVTLSLIFLVLFSPLLAVMLLALVASRRTAAFIVSAQRRP